MTKRPGTRPAEEAEKEMPVKHIPHSPNDLDPVWEKSLNDLKEFGAISSWEFRLDQHRGWVLLMDRTSDCCNPHAIDFTIDLDQAEIAIGMLHDGWLMGRFHRSQFTDTEQKQFQNMVELGQQKDIDA